MKGICGIAGLIIRSACLILPIMMITSALYAEDDQGYSHFKRTQYYTLKLTIAQLKYGFIEKNSMKILQRISDSYKENDLISSMAECVTAVNRIMKLSDNLNCDGSGGVRIFYNVLGYNCSGDSAMADVQMVAYYYKNNPVKRTENVRLYLLRKGGGWQIYRSDGWLKKMERLLSIEIDKEVVSSKEKEH